MKRLAFAMLFGLIAAAPAHAITITYYTIASNDPDANNLTEGVVTNEVQNALGPDGLPVLNIPQFGCTSNCYTVTGAPGFPNGGSTPNVNVNSLGEITYWSPSLNPFVTETLQTPTTLPFNVSYNFFAPNGTGSQDGGTNGYQAAVLSGILSAPTTEQLSFTIGSDDMAFAYIDGQLVCSDGGVHSVSTVPCTTPTISAGDHSFELFFVDINTTQAGLTFTVQTQGVTIDSGNVPEPASLAVFGAGMLGLGIARRRRAA